MTYMKYLFSLILALLVAPGALWAATVTTGAASNEVSVEQAFEVFVMIDTEGKKVNAIGGELLYSGDFLSIDYILDGRSIVPLWVDKPAVEADSTDGGLRKITFSGLIPGGFEGRNANIFSVVFRGKQTGKTALQTRGIQVLEHSPTGNQLPSNESQFIVTIDELGEAPVVDVELNDNRPPEPFQPTVAKGELFGNEYFVIFNALDTDSGISHYELLESTTSFDTIVLLERQDLPWKRVENPARLIDQSLSSFVYVKAVDKLGNARIEKLDPREQVVAQTESNYSIISFIVVFITFLVVALLVYQRQHARIRNRKTSQLENQPTEPTQD